MVQGCHCINLNYIKEKNVCRLVVSFINYFNIIEGVKGYGILDLIRDMMDTKCRK